MAREVTVRDVAERPFSLEAREISAGYRSRPRVLRGWSARFVPGEFTALTGPSGVGKSTALFTLGLMLVPESGSVWVHGSAVSRRRERARAGLRASSFGFVFQDAALDTRRSIIDNVREGELYRADPHPDPSRRARALLEQVGVDVPPGRRANQLSGGQAQRISLCRAIFADPRIVLADEPTGNLDADSKGAVLGMLRRHADRGNIVVVATHDADTIAVSDREIRLRQQGAACQLSWPSQQGTP